MRSRPGLAPRQSRSSSSWAVVLCAVLGACSTTSTPTHFHSLMPGEVAAGAAAPPPGPAMVVALEPIRLPAQVDQPQWVVRLPDDSIAVLEQERWAGPLRDEFRDALLEQLIVRHGAIDARTQPAGSAASMRIALDVRRFDSFPGREARIEGSWTIQGGQTRGASARCEWRLRESAAGPLGALAPAHRRAIARLADALAQALGRAARGETVVCPPLDEPR